MSFRLPNQGFVALTMQTGISSSAAMAKRAHSNAYGLVYAMPIFPTMKAELQTKLNVSAQPTRTADGKFMLMRTGVVGLEVRISRASVF